MKSHRKERVASVVREIVSHAITHTLNDPRIDPLTTVTRVQMVGDLEIARVYLTVPGNEAAERRTLRAVRHARGFLQRIVAAQMIIRQCPEIEFEIDVAAKRARETMQLLAENRRRRPDLFEEEAPLDAAEDGDEDVARPDGVDASDEVGDVPPSTAPRHDSPTEHEA